MPETNFPEYVVYVTENEGDDPKPVTLTEEQYLVYVMSGKLPIAAPQVSEQG